MNIDSISDLTPCQDLSQDTQLIIRNLKGITNDQGSLESCSCSYLLQAFSHSAKNNKEIVNPFNNALTITQKEMKVIKEIIEYLDNKTTLALGLPSNQKHLKDEGKKIEHVHPLCFIWSILIQPDLKKKLMNFRDNSAFSLKWNGFLGYSLFHDKGFGKNMEKYYNHRRPEEYHAEFQDFYKTLHLREEIMQPFAVTKNWRDFASALLDSRSYY